jgi:CTP:molybdopterin cytidylyltransferase MocA
VRALYPIVLAAGEGRRLGGPKALALLDGRTFLERVLAACRAAALREALVVVGAESERVLGAIPPVFPVRYVLNPDWPKGQTSSIQRGLEALPEDAEGFLLWPVDVPVVPASAVDAGLKAFEPGRSAIVALSDGRRRGHPVLFDASYREAFLALRPEDPAHRVIRGHEAAVRYVLVDHPGPFLDIDRPEDLERARRLVRGSA